MYDIMTKKGETYRIYRDKKVMGSATAEVLWAAGGLYEALAWAMARVPCEHSKHSKYRRAMKLLTAIGEVE